MGTTRKVKRALTAPNALPRLTSASDSLAQTLNPQELKMGKKLGEGGCGTVYAAVYQGEKVAVKEFTILEQLISESDVAVKFDSANIVTPLGRCFYPHYLLLELAPLGSLESFVSEKTVALGTRVRLALDICDGIAAMHTGQMVHRDLKPGNILIFQDRRRRFRAKITDFSLAEPINSNARLCTFFYKAPELFVKRKLVKSTAADIYAFGFVLLHLLSKGDEFDKHFGDYYVESDDSILNKSNGVLLKKVHSFIAILKMHKLCNPFIEALIISCINNNPLARPSLQQIKEKLHLLNQPAKDDIGLVKYSAPIMVQSAQAFYWVERAFSDVIFNENMAMNDLQALHGVADEKAQNEVTKEYNSNVYLDAKWKSYRSDQKNVSVLRSLASATPNNTSLIRLACENLVDADYVASVFFFRSYRERLIRGVTQLGRKAEEKENPVELIEAFLAGNRIG